LLSTSPVKSVVESIVAGQSYESAPAVGHGKEDLKRRIIPYLQNYMKRAHFTGQTPF